MALPPEVALQLQRFSQAVSSLEQRTKTLSESLSDQQQPPATGKQSAAASEPTLPPTHLQRARQHMELARTVHALAVLLFRAHGVDIKAEGGTLAAELGRIEQFQKKVAKAEAAETLRTSHPAAAVDVAAANRFISHALPDLTAEQKQKLREDTAAVKAALAGQAEHKGAAGRGKRGPASGAAASGGAAKRTRASGKGGGAPVSAKDAALQFLDSIREEARAVPGIEALQSGDAEPGAAEE